MMRLSQNQKKITNSKEGKYFLTALKLPNAPTTTPTATKINIKVYMIVLGFTNLIIAVNSCPPNLLYK